jgi:hypothetical protein
MTGEPGSLAMKEAACHDRFPYSDLVAHWHVVTALRVVITLGLVHVTTEKQQRAWDMS